MIARWVASCSVCQGRVMPWKYGAVSPRGQRLLHEHVDGGAVLGVHHDQPAVAGRRLHGLQDLPVVGQEDARVGHEQLEAGDALADQLVHRLERVVVDVADDLVEAVVDRAVAAGLLVPERDLVLHALARAPARRSRRSSSCRPRPPRGCRSRRCPTRCVPPNGISMCVCASMPPGITYLPVASMTVSRAAIGAEQRRAGREHGRDRLAVDQHVRDARDPVAVTTVPPLMSVVVTACHGPVV